MNAITGTKRPNVVGIVGLSILGGVLGIYGRRREFSIVLAGVPFDMISA
jgi:LPXTG-motif cell wall-anchored protein